MGGLASRTSRRISRISRYSGVSSSSRLRKATVLVAGDAGRRLGGDVLRLRAPARQFLKYFQEGVDHGRVELRAAAALQFGQAFGVRERRFVGSPARHGVVGVHDGHGARQQGDGVPGKAVGIAVAVVVLVMMAHALDQRLGEERADDVGAEHGVQAHLLPLLRVQATRA